jgi:hypothetical protein
LDNHKIKKAFTEKLLGLLVLPARHIVLNSLFVEVKKILGCNRLDLITVNSRIAVTRGPKYSEAELSPK